nr:hypothetical protein Iba_chr05fCG2740 [Ipomoea batatas]
MDGSRVRVLSVEYTHIKSTSNLISIEIQYSMGGDGDEHALLIPESFLSDAKLEMRRNALRSTSLRSFDELSTVVSVARSLPSAFSNHREDQKAKKHLLLCYSDSSSNRHHLKLPIQKANTDRKLADFRKSGSSPRDQTIGGNQSLLLVSPLDIITGI